MVLPADVVRAAKGFGASDSNFDPLGTIQAWLDERRRRYMLPRRAFLRLRSLSLRHGRAKPDAFLAAIARLPNEMAWHVLSFWPAEADVAPPSTPSPRG